MLQTEKFLWFLNGNVQTIFTNEFVYVSGNIYWHQSRDFIHDAARLPHILNPIIPGNCYYYVARTEIEN